MTLGEMALGEMTISHSIRPKQLDQRRTLPSMLRIPDVSAKDVSAKTWRRTFRQKNMPKRLRLKSLAETFRMICGAYSVYARSPSPSQRPAPTREFKSSKFSSWSRKLGPGLGLESRRSRGKSLEEKSRICKSLESKS